MRHATAKDTNARRDFMIPARMNAPRVHQIQHVHPRTNLYASPEHICLVTNVLHAHKMQHVPVAWNHFIARMDITGIKKTIVYPARGTHAMGTKSYVVAQDIICIVPVSACHAGQHTIVQPTVALLV